MGGQAIESTVWQRARSKKLNQEHWQGKLKFQYWKLCRNVFSPLKSNCLEAQPNLPSEEMLSRYWKLSEEAVVKAWSGWMKAGKFSWEVHGVECSQEALSVFFFVGHVQVATGAFMFLADLVRKIKLPVAVDLIRVQSYGARTQSSGVANLMTDIRIDIKGKHVLLVSLLYFASDILTK